MQQIIKLIRNNLHYGEQQLRRTQTIIVELNVIYVRNRIVQLKVRKQQIEV